MRPILRHAHLVHSALVAFLMLAVLASAPSAQEAPRAGQFRRKSAPTSEEFGAPLRCGGRDDAREAFWDKDRLDAVGWEQRAAAVRQSVVEAPSLEEAARRINALLGELKTSHTGLLTPDDVDYYVLLDVFRRRARRSRRWSPSASEGDRRAGYAGIGLFSARIDGRDFVDAVLEGSPAERAGLKVGDEIVSVDGAPYHPIRSFRGKIGEQVARHRPPRRERPDRDARGRGGEHRAAARLPRGDAGQRARHRAGGPARRLRARVGLGRRRVASRPSDDALAKLGVNQHSGKQRRRDARRASTLQRVVVPLDGLIVDMRGKIGGTARNAGRYLDVARSARTSRALAQQGYPDRQGLPSADARRC